MQLLPYSKQKTIKQVYESHLAYIILCFTDGTYAKINPVIAHDDLACNYINNYKPSEWELNRMQRTKGTK